jgi:hypothetical protein
MKSEEPNYTDISLMWNEGDESQKSEHLNESDKLDKYLEDWINGRFQEKEKERKETDDVFHQKRSTSEPNKWKRPDKMHPKPKVIRRVTRKYVNIDWVE